MDPTAKTWQKSPSVMVLGPAHSGKSEFAHTLLSPTLPATIVGTGDEMLSEMRERVAVLRAQRSSLWRTMSVGAELLPSLRSIQAGGVVMIDSINQWLATLIVAASGKYDPTQLEHHVDQEVTALLHWLASETAGRVVLVTAEVGASPPPQNDSGRLFRRIVGQTNQRLAAHCETVISLQAGLATQLK